MTDDTLSNLKFDQALSARNALQQDKLRRVGFATSAVDALRQVSSAAGFVVSIEGAWGSGKSSVLAMMEALLRKSDVPPVIVHFNPWQIGEKDALLRAFLGKIARQLELSDRVGPAKKAAKSLKAYSKVFDVIKLVPGAGGLAGAVQDIFSALGETLGAAAEAREKDVEGQKRVVEKALKDFNRRIIVFIDDIDRLFPEEVFEMVRIVKAVGDLPNVGYVVAWDQEYVGAALKEAGVPRSETYLDKVVQVRLPLPAVGHAARERLFDDELKGLPAEATAEHFRGAMDRLSLLYMSGLRDLLEQPRDFTRLFNTATLIEPALRGEVVLADILGLAALMVKAPAVYDLLKREPQSFVGRMPNGGYSFDKNDEIVKAAGGRRADALKLSSWPDATKRLLHQLFPLVAKADGAITFGKVNEAEGLLAEPKRLMVALQLHVGSQDVSFVLARKFLREPHERRAIAHALAVETASEFLEAVGDLALQLPMSSDDAMPLCVDIASLLEDGPLLQRAHLQGRFFSVSMVQVALVAIASIVRTSAPTEGPRFAEALISNARGLTLATELFMDSYEYSNKNGETLLAPKEKRDELASRLTANLMVAAKTGEIFALSNSGRVLACFPTVNRSAAPQMLANIRALDPTLDKFAMTILGHTYDSTNGQRFDMPDELDRIEAYLPLHEFKAHAAKRLLDTSLRLPALAAWRSVVEDAAIYAIDGTRAERR